MAFNFEKFIAYPMAFKIKNIKKKKILCLSGSCPSYKVGGAFKINK